MEDLFFFIFVGLIVLFVSLKKPEDHEFEKRIESVANAQNTDKKSKLILIDSVKSLLAFDKVTNVSIVLQEFDQEKDAFKVFPSIESTIVNMCNDVKYPLISKKVIVTPGVKVNESYGSISYLGINEIGGQQRNEIITGPGKPPINLDRYKYEKNIDFEINGDSTAIWRLDFQIWSLVSDIENKKGWYYHTPERFSSNYILEIENKCNFDVALSYEIPENRVLKLNARSDKLVLKNSEKRRICKSDQIEADKRVAIHFSPFN